MSLDLVGALKRAKLREKAGLGASEPADVPTCSDGPPVGRDAVGTKISINNQWLDDFVPTVPTVPTEKGRKGYESEVERKTRAPRGEGGEEPFQRRDSGSSNDRSDYLEIRSCPLCAHLRRPGLSSGYCSVRIDLPSAYGPGHPLHQLPADGGTSCTSWTPFPTG